MISNNAKMSSNNNNIDEFGRDLSLKIQKPVQVETPILTQEEENAKVVEDKVGKADKAATEAEEAHRKANVDAPLIAGIQAQIESLHLQTERLKKQMGEWVSLYEETDRRGRPTGKRLHQENQPLFRQLSELHDQMNALRYTQGRDLKTMQADLEKAKKVTNKKLLEELNKK
jgi:hypothetical protein